jgi:hypothetical protein
MRLGQRSQNAGVKLWQVAKKYKDCRDDLTDGLAFKLAILSHPDLGESYLGHPVRRDGHADVVRILYSPVPLTGNEI